MNWQSLNGNKARKLSSKERGILHQIEELVKRQNLARLKNGSSFSTRPPVEIMRMEVCHAFLPDCVAISVLKTPVQMGGLLATVIGAG